MKSTRWAVDESRGRGFSRATNSCKKPGALALRDVVELVGNRSCNQCLALAAQQSSLFDLKEKLQGLQVASRLGHRLSPSIKPMTAQQNPVSMRMRLQRHLQLCGKILIVLGVFQNRHPLDIRMAGHAREPLQQFVSFNGHIAARRMASRD